MSVLDGLGQLDRKPKYHRPFRDLTHFLPTCGPRELANQPMQPVTHTEETPVRVKAPSIRSLVLNALKESGPQTLDGLASSMNFIEERIGALQIRDTLGHLRRSGLVIRDDQGRYCLTSGSPAQVEAPPPAPARSGVSSRHPAPDLCLAVRLGRRYPVRNLRSPHGRPRDYFSDPAPLARIPLARVLPARAALALRDTGAIPDAAQREAHIDYLVSRFRAAYPHLYRADLGTIGE